MKTPPSASICICVELLKDNSNKALEERSIRGESSMMQNKRKRIEELKEELVIGLTVQCELSRKNGERIVELQKLLVRSAE